MLQRYLQPNPARFNCIVKRGSWWSIPNHYRSSTSTSYLSGGRHGDCAELLGGKSGEGRYSVQWCISLCAPPTGGSSYGGATKVLEKGTSRPLVGARNQASTAGHGSSFFAYRARHYFPHSSASCYRLSYLPYLTTGGPRLFLVICLLLF